MSRPFMKDLFQIYIRKVYDNIFEPPLQIKCAVIISTLGGHACYAYGTEEDTSIIVTKKYTFTRNGFTDFMIVDKDGKHYNVNNSVWFWKWDSIEDWTDIKLNEPIHIKYYGLRIPIFSIFPNVVKTKFCVADYTVHKNDYHTLYSHHNTVHHFLNKYSYNSSSV